MTDKLYINDVSCMLGLGGMPNLHALNEILHKVKEGNFSIYFNAEIYGVETIHGLNPIFNEDGSVTKVMVGVNPEYFSNEKRKTIVRPSESHNGNMAIITFSFNNKEYYPVDKTGMWYEVMTLSYTRFYCLRAELEAYIDEWNGVTKTKTIPEQRREALVALIDEVGQVTVDGLTRQQKWELLKDREPELFDTKASSMNGFFGKNKDLYAFKQGRPKKR